MQAILGAQSLEDFSQIFMKAQVGRQLGWTILALGGRQYGLLAVGRKKYSDQKAFDTNPLAHLFDVYVKISTDFKPEEDEFKAAKKRGEDTAILESRGLLGEVKAYFKRMGDGDEAALAL